MIWICSVCHILSPLFLKILCTLCPSITNLAACTLIRIAPHTWCTISTVSKLYMPCTHQVAFYHLIKGDLNVLCLSYPFLWAPNYSVHLVPPQKLNIAAFLLSRRALFRRCTNSTISILYTQCTHLCPFYQLRQYNLNVFCLSCPLSLVVKYPVHLVPPQ